MKEATGEANMTIITVVLIGLVAAAAAIFLPRLLNNVENNIDCQAQGLCVGANGACVECDAE